jgi:glycosyltransferase involved in cell wall biosynthesis
MPKVLRIINRLNLGGPTFNAAYLSRYLAPEFETMLVSGIKEETEESSEFIVEQMGLKPVYIPEMHREISLGSDRKAYLRIKEIIGDFKPDIVHTHAAKAGTLGRLAAASMKVPVVIHTFHGHVFHSYFSPAKTLVFRAIERYLSSISTGIIAISDLQKHELCDVYKVCTASKTHVIPLGFDLSRFRNDQEQLRRSFRDSYHIDDRTLVVAIIGRLVPVKNHRLFLDAIARVKSIYKGKMTGLIVGDGEDRMALENYCLQLGLTFSVPGKPVESPDVIFTSWIKDVERPMAGCDIVAMTSLNEGTPVSLIEAQAASKPIVTTIAGGIADVVSEGKTALLSPSGDVVSFSDNLIRLLEDEQLRSSMTLSGWPFVESRFHYTRLVEDVRQLYRSLLTEARSKS